MTSVNHIAGRSLNLTGRALLCASLWLALGLGLPACDKTTGDNVLESEGESEGSGNEGSGNESATNGVAESQPTDDGSSATAQGHEPGHAEYGHEGSGTSEPEHAGHGDGSGEHVGHGNHDGMVHDFSDAELWARIFDDPDRDAWQLPQEVVALMAIEPGMIVADIGAGTGYFLPYLSTAVGDGGKVFALDIEQNLVDHMTQRATDAGMSNVEARVVASDDPGLLAESVDRILIVDTWHHIGDRGDYASRLAAALRPGGVVYIVDFTMESDHGPSVEHRLTPEQVSAELTAGGLTVEVTEEPLPDQYIVLGRRP